MQYEPMYIPPCKYVSFFVQLKYIFGGFYVRFDLCNARRICLIALGTSVFHSTVFRQFSRVLCIKMCIMCNFRFL